MRFLPIVDRELRVASRRWTTFLVRGGVGLLAMILAVPGLFFGWLTGGGSGAGQGAFAVLSNYIFVVAVAGGLFITADCLSAEKREGTLGLLFLTDLRGHDVVLGKFAALGLHAMYGLLAVFPSLALPLLTGGVTGSEFWRVSLALLNLLFVSLSMGMAVSAASREASRAFSVTLIVMVFLVAVLPLSLSLLERLGGPGWIAKVAWANPGHAFAVGKAGGAYASSEYWISLAFSHMVAWGLLIAAAVILPHSWQDQHQGHDKPGLMGRLVGVRVARIFQCKRSRVWLDQNPMLWLMGERPVLKIILWSIAGGWCLCVLAACVVLGSKPIAGVVFGWSLVILLVFAVALVEHSCRFWVESRQNGNLEALLAVPVESGEILSSHWASIRRHFMWPLLVVIAAATLPAWGALGSELLSSRSSGDRLLGSLILYAYMAFIIFWFLATYIAIGYTGMWLALKLRRPQFASGLTLLCVILLPMMLCYLGLGITLVFIFLPMSLLQSNLRAMILQRYMPIVKSQQKPAAAT